ncbi:uncharacterized protein [Prorops nasuta]|uniref:uncharacterized protein n=1 Tax=Prorops nasuta TaxID=863751 RepID=UPI0034D00980
MLQELEPAKNISQHFYERFDKLEQLLNKRFDQLVAQLGTMTRELITMQDNITMLKTSSCNPLVLNNIENNLTLPFSSLESFLQFDGTLKEKESLRKDIISMMWPLIKPKQKLSKSISRILAKFFNRDLIMNFTAVKQVSSKLVLKNTTFCETLYSVVQKVCNEIPNSSPVTEKKFYEALGAVISNAKDWDGHRKHRNQVPLIASSPMYFTTPKNNITDNL